MNRIMKTVPLELGEDRSSKSLHRQDSNTSGIYIWIWWKASLNSEASGAKENVPHHFRLVWIQWSFHKFCRERFPWKIPMDWMPKPAPLLLTPDEDLCKFCKKRIPTRRLLKVVMCQTLWRSSQILRRKGFNALSAQENVSAPLPLEFAEDPQILQKKDTNASDAVGKDILNLGEPPKTFTESVVEHRWSQYDDGSFNSG